MSEQSRLDEPLARERAAEKQRGRPPKGDRIDVRVTPELKRLMQDAAQLRHTTVSQYMVDASVAAAEMDLASRTSFRLTAEQWQAFLAVLDRPETAAPPKPRLERLFAEPSVLERK